MKKLLTTVLILSSLALPSFAESGSDPLYYKITVDTLEKQDNPQKALSWESNIWVGHDLNKVYLYSEGEKSKGSSAESENQLVFSHAISPYWDIQLGFGYDKTPDAHHNWGVIALKGMAPYFIETKASFLAGKDGTMGLRFEAEYKAFLTQKLILTPSVSTALYTKDIPDMELGRGLSTIATGVRLSYEIVREFAPYIGIEWKKNYGKTNDFNPLDETYAVAGFKFWF